LVAGAGSVGVDEREVQPVAPEIRYRVAAQWRAAAGNEVERVDTKVAGEDVDASAATNAVVAGSPLDGVVADFPVDLVVAFAAVYPVVAIVAVNFVVAGLTVDDVVTDVADQDVVAAWPRMVSLPARASIVSALAVPVRVSSPEPGIGPPLTLANSTPFQA
jgi:hypothetical protein